MKPKHNPPGLSDVEIGYVIIIFAIMVAIAICLKDILLAF